MPRLSRSSRVKMMRGRRGRGIIDGPLITQRAKFSGMGAKRTKRTYVSRMGMGKRRKRRGGSFLSKANEFIKKHKLVSKIAGEVAKSSGPFGQIGRVVQDVAKKYGYGSRGIMTGMGAKRPRKRRGGMMGMGAKRKVVRKRRGGSVFSDINDWLKRNKVLSTIGSVLTPLTGSFAPLTGGLTAYARSQGYGAKKRMHTRRGGNNPYPTTNSFYGKPVF